MYKQLGSHSECVSDKVRYFNFTPYAGVDFISTPQESRQTLYLLFLNTSPFLSKRRHVFKNVLTFLKNIGKKLRYEKSLQKFHQDITRRFTISPCEPSSITETSPSFTKNRVVKLVNLGETRQVSHGETINQVVMKR